MIIGSRDSELIDEKSSSPAADQPNIDLAKLKRDFESLASEWKEQGKYLSSPTAIANLPAYKAIVAMGKTAVPFILRDLEREPDLWFTALKRIVGESPVPEAARGNIRLMAEAWLNWGRENGFIA